MEEPGKLDWGQAVRNSYATLYHHFGTYLLIVIAWVAILYTVAQSTFILAPSIFEAFPALSSFAHDTKVIIVAVIITLPVSLVVVSGMITLIVAFHRIVILRQRVMTPFPVSAEDILRYAWRLAVLFAPFMLAAAVLITLIYIARPEDPAELDAKGIYIVGPILVATVSAAMIFGRLSIVLPATATGATTVTLAQAWRMTRGNTWAIFWGMTFCAVPFNFVSNLIEKRMDDLPEGSIGTYFAALVAMIIVDAMGYAVSAAFISQTYLHFRGDTERMLDDEPMAQP
jgi:hypothetical protein